MTSEVGRVHSKEFNALATDFNVKEIEILKWKAGEYCDGADRLMNFRQIAELMDIKMSEVALLYLMKHIQSIVLAVKEDKVKWVWETEGGEGTKQRISDARNYLILLAACIQQEEG